MNKRCAILWLSFTFFVSSVFLEWQEVEAAAKCFRGTLAIDSGDAVLGIGLWQGVSYHTFLLLTACLAFIGAVVVTMKFRGSDRALVLFQGALLGFMPVLLFAKFLISYNLVKL